MTQAEYDALRKKATGVRDLDQSWRVAKARNLVERQPTASKSVSTAYVPTAPQGTPLAVNPNKVLAVDPAMAKSGMAWGRPGEKPEGAIIYRASGTQAKDFEGHRLHRMASAIVAEAINQGCGLIVFSEFYSTKFMLSARANISLRGALMAEAARHGLNAVGLPEITARKVAGVDLSKPKDGEEPKGYMKRRARARLEQLDLGHLGEDDGDAAILLLGSKHLVGARQ